ncbi:MAG: hypothetical protein HOD97_07490 [Candidatus Marinimicrobia bacterium]|jgi:ABC-type uncharacterized transport system permease subunit|nr:hypothetical protein [Candidatus Neomarinimicrobiota bacterium]MBT3618333.1 hypothetical protein [Candidatus Neomarinimicrobiota bacterium]MBT3829128.1 hypothetical protein [Candidatus Neomarinimicrobiota bacterium]MBT3998096.1 hypothetical protein [Candidatus Neomarinimicrobiota bacterium]MBT4281437.1 hypothetical protein [Candidatus Neomarinimicrobiota bacterium]
MIVALFKRRWWLIQNRLFSTIGFSLMFPILLYVMIFMVLNTIIRESGNHVPYGEWVFPGFVVLSGSFVIMPILFRDFFDLRIHGRVLLNLTLSPSSKTGLVTGLILTSLAESILFSVVAVGVLLTLLQTSFGLMDYLIMIAFSCVFNFVLANSIVTLSLLINRTSLFMLSILALFILITFGSGLLFELGFYPDSVGQILKFIPTSVIVQCFHSILFLHHIDWLLLFGPIIVAGFWTLLNGFILKRTLNQ